MENSWKNTWKIQGMFADSTQNGDIRRIVLETLPLYLYILLSANPDLFAEPLSLKNLPSHSFWFSLFCGT